MSFFTVGANETIHYMGVCIKRLSAEWGSTEVSFILPPGRTQEAKEILISTENRFHLQRSDCFSVMQSTCKAFFSYSPDLES